MLEVYYYETPQWAVVILCSFFLIASAPCFMAFYYWNHWAGDAPILIKWLFFAMWAMFLAVGLMPRNWKPWRYFYADRQGLHFPSECPQTANTMWLQVPWKNVGTIERRTFYGGEKGPSIELILTDEEIDRFFRNDKLARKIFGRKIRDNGYFRVGYSNAFKRIDKAVRILNELRDVE